MRIATIVARILLGLLFLVFGLNGFLHFIPATMPGGAAGQFLQLLSVTHYAAAIFFVQIVGGILLLLNRFVPLALLLLGPVLVNILLFHILMQPSGLPPGLIATVLWAIVFYGVRPAFAGVFAQKVEIGS